MLVRVFSPTRFQVGQWLAFLIRLSSLYSIGTAWQSVWVVRWNKESESEAREGWKTDGVD